MRMYDLIQRKKEGKSLHADEIRAFVTGYTAGEIPDYQAAALCMAICLRGMDEEETAALTFAIRDSGEILSFPELEGVRVDKHSTGGVGDKTSLVVAPIVAACGIPIAKMSGRGLGHTGGTVDKLESIPGLRTDLSMPAFVQAVKTAGIAIVGQSADLAPADKKLYALRDVTATVDSIPLIASSIMGKKLAANDDCILLDTKTGSGAFMKSLPESQALAELMVRIGKKAGKKMLARITNMDAPLGNTIGNSLEVEEAIEALSGKGPRDLRQLSLCLAADMLELAGKGDHRYCEALAEEALGSGRALERFAWMVQTQGGDPEAVLQPGKLPIAPCRKEVLSPTDGYIASCDAAQYGIASLLLGAGRSRKEDRIDLTAGIRLYAKPGDRIKRGEPIAMLYTSDSARFEAAEKTLLQATRYRETPPGSQPLLLGEVR